MEDATRFKNGTLVNFWNTNFRDNGRAIELWAWWGDKKHRKSARLTVNRKHTLE